jgi:hypothetical protein
MAPFTTSCCRSFAKRNAVGMSQTCQKQSSPGEPLGAPGVLSARHVGGSQAVPGPAKANTAHLDEPSRTKAGMSVVGRSRPHGKANKTRVSGLGCRTSALDQIASLFDGLTAEQVAGRLLGRFSGLIWKRGISASVTIGLTTGLLDALNIDSWKAKRGMLRWNRSL